MLDKELVKNIASELKLDICRITHGGNLNQKDILKNRKDSDFWPQPFTETNIQRLTDLSAHLDHLKSVIVTGVNYNSENEKPYLSKYVTKKDYHAFLKDQMQKLVERLREKLGEDFGYEIFIDTAPFLEKALAVRAGAGFMGKNTMVIHPRYGSYIFLGEILTDLEIEIDHPLDMSCGDCRLCLDNCEGGALRKAYLVDGHRCISYLTQKKGYLTVEERKLIGRHIWGCDECQKVCPYNQNSSEKTKYKEMELFDKDLEYFLRLDRKNVPSELEDTAILWRGSRILIRNAMMAAANLNKIEYFDLIKERLQDNSSIIRFYAVWSLSELDYDRSRTLLKKHLSKEPDKKVQKEIKRILDM